MPQSPEGSSGDGRLTHMSVSSRAVGLRKSVPCWLLAAGYPIFPGTWTFHRAACNIAACLIGVSKQENNRVKCVIKMMSEAFIT